jgi:hypothetical protein
MTPTSHLRGAALGDAARIAGAADLLLVHARGPRLTLSEGLIAGEHWRGPLALDSGVEPLVREALAGNHPVRCTPGQRRRVVGPYWAAGAVLVPYHDQRGSTIVVLAGFASPPTDGAARYAAAAVRAFFPTDEGAPPPPANRPPPPQRRTTAHRDALTGLLNRDGWEETVRRRDAGGDGPHAVLLVDVAVEEQAAMRRVAGAVRANARSADLVARVAPTQIAVLMRGGHLSGCMETAVRVRTLLASDPLSPAVAMGWAAAAEPAALPRALEVARAMVAQERRARAADAGA